MHKPIILLQPEINTSEERISSRKVKGKEGVEIHKKKDQRRLTVQNYY